MMKKRFGLPIPIPSDRLPVQDMKPPKSEDRELVVEMNDGPNITLRPGDWLNLTFKRAIGLTTKKVAEFNRRTAAGERVQLHAKNWVAMDRKTYEELTKNSDIKITVDKGEHLPEPNETQHIRKGL